MTDPLQNRIGKILGIAGKTITDLYDGVTTIGQAVTVLPQLAADVAAVRAQIDKLVGIGAAPANWQGVPAVLGYDSANGGASMMDYWGGIEALLSAMNVKLGSSPSGTLASILTQLTALRGVPATDIRALLTAVTALQTPLADVQANTGSLSLVAGTLAESPSGETLKSLLRDLLACCEDGGGGTPPEEPVNQAPASLCIAGDGWSEPYRVASWVDLGTVAGLTSWGAQWPADGPPNFAPVADINPNLDWTGLVKGSPDEQELCFSWDFTGNTVQPTGGSVKLEQSGGWTATAGGNAIVSFSIPIGNVTRSTTVNVAYGLILQTNEGSGPPALNAFVKSRFVAP